MLHYEGDITAMELGREGLHYLWCYRKEGSNTAYVPYMDLVRGKKRFIKYGYLLGQWVFLDLVNSEGD